MKTPLLVGADRAVLEAYDKNGELVGFTRLAPPPDGADGAARLAGHLPVPAGGYLILDDDPPADATASTWGAGPRRRAEQRAASGPIPGASPDMDLLTTDPQVWAREFIHGYRCGRFVSTELDERDGPIDEGTLAAWFAHAIEAGRRAGGDQ